MTCHKIVVRAIGIAAKCATTRSGCVKSANEMATAFILWGKETVGGGAKLRAK